MFLCLPFLLPTISLLFTKAIEFGVETVQLENSRKIQILKHNNISDNLSETGPSLGPAYYKNSGGEGTKEGSLPRTLPGH